jgi:murein peptide amidase A
MGQRTDRRANLDRRTFLTGVGAAAVTAAGGLLVSGVAEASSRPKPQKFVVGHSRLGRPIRAYLIGDPDAFCTYVVQGQMHGDEPAGPLICANRLLKIAPLNDIAFWVIPTINPDGSHRDTRDNAHHVDLNRNFPSKTWRHYGKGTRFYSGPHPASEPETRAMVRFYSKIQPHTIISMHQPLDCVDYSGGDPDVTRWLAHHLRLPSAHLGTSTGQGYPGPMSSWFNGKFHKQTCVTVELPAHVNGDYRDHVAKTFVEHAEHRKRQLKVAQG